MFELACNLINGFQLTERLRIQITFGKTISWTCCVEGPRDMFVLNTAICITKKVSVFIDSCQLNAAMSEKCDTSLIVTSIKRERTYYQLSFDFNLTNKNSYQYPEYLCIIVLCWNIFALFCRYCRQVDTFSLKEEQISSTFFIDLKLK